MAFAQEAPPAPPVAEPPPPSPAEPPPPPAAPAPYSLPFQLRPVTATTSARWDSSFAKYENAASQGGFTFVSMLGGSYKIPGTGGQGEGLAPLVKVAIVNDSPPTGTGGLALVNPLVGASYALKLGAGFRASAFLGFTIPIGMGGGDTPDKGAADARNAGPLARAAMDNALFAVNDFTVIPGIDVAWVGHGFTAQIEATLFQLMRVRGSAADPDASKTNFTTGIHAGYFVLDMLSIGAELRYQRWLQAPLAVQKDATGALVDNVTFGVGPRLHFEVGGMWIRPGLAYTRGIDAPMAAAANYHIVQLDVPVVF
jgi:hypothetical protein